MKPIPLPYEVPWEIQMLLWAGLIIIGLVGAGLLFFVRRYVIQQDENNKSIKGKITDLETAAKNKDEAMLKISGEIKDAGTKIDQAVAKMSELVTSSESRTMKELLEIHRASNEIRMDFTVIKSQATVLKKDMESLSETAKSQAKTNSLVAQAFATQKESITKLNTEVLRINDDLIMVRNKKQ